MKIRLPARLAGLSVCLLALISIAPAANAVQFVSCNKGGSKNPILQGSGVAGGATCTFSGFQPSTAITLTGGLHLTPTSTNVDGSATGVLYSTCTDALGDYVLTFTAGATTANLNVTVAPNPDFATVCASATTTSTTTSEPTTTSSTPTSAPTTTAQPARVSPAVAATPSFTG